MEADIRLVVSAHSKNIRVMSSHVIPFHVVESSQIFQLYQATLKYPKRSFNTYQDSSFFLRSKYPKYPKLSKDPNYPNYPNYQTIKKKKTSKYPKILWMAATSCTTKRMVKTGTQLQYVINNIPQLVSWISWTPQPSQNMFLNVSSLDIILEHIILKHIVLRYVPTNPRYKVVPHDL